MAHHSLLLQEVDKFDVSKLAKVPLEPIVIESLKVLDIANVNVPGCARMDSEGQGGRQWSRILTPPYLQATIVQRETLV